MTSRIPRSAAASIIGAKATRPAGVPEWNSRGRPSGGPAASTATARPAVASTMNTSDPFVSGMNRG